MSKQLFLAKLVAIYAYLTTKDHGSVLARQVKSLCVALRQLGNEVDRQLLIFMFCELLIYFISTFEHLTSKFNREYCEIIYICWTLNFMYFAGRANNEF